MIEQISDILKDTNLCVNFPMQANEIWLTMRNSPLRLFLSSLV